MQTFKNGIGTPLETPDELIVKDGAKKELLYRTVLATRWFDKKNGNTYHTVRLYRNSHFFTSKHFTYGYGTHYEQTALELLKDNGYCKDCQFYYEAVQEFNGNVLTLCKDVSRRKDL